MTLLPVISVATSVASVLFVVLSRPRICNHQGPWQNITCDRKPSHQGAHESFDGGTRYLWSHCLVCRIGLKDENKLICRQCSDPQDGTA